MNYYIKETLGVWKNKKNALGKPKTDTYIVLESMGVKQIPLNNNLPSNTIFSKIIKTLVMWMKWKIKTRRLKKGDILFENVPSSFHFGFKKKHKRIIKKGVKLIFLIHDLDSLRFPDSAEELIEKENYNKQIDRIIVHNKKMHDVLVERGFDKDKMICLEIFDYIIPNYDTNLASQRKIGKNEPICFAGNLDPEKSGFLYKLPSDYKINIYGSGYKEEIKDSKTYKGAFLPDELVYKIEGSFGFVWDGSSIDTCDSGFGNYLRYNNPYKTSMYLASDLPVVIWKEAALAEFVEKNKCGIVVSSLSEVYDKINKLSDEEYEEMRENAKRVGKDLREGKYFSAAIKKAIDDLSTKPSNKISTNQFFE